MDFLHAAIILFVASVTLWVNIFMSGVFVVSLWTLVTPMPMFVLGIVYLMAYLRGRNKPDNRFPG